MTVKISFVVLTYNRVDALLLVLKALAAQCGAEHEVVIADDGSTAQAIDALKDDLPVFRCAVKHVWHPDIGFTASRARNLGVICCDGKYLVFIDGDCIPNPRFVQAHESLARVGCFVNGNRVLLGQQLTQRITCGNLDLANAGLVDWLGWRFRGEINKLAHLVFWPSLPGRSETNFRWRQIRSCNFALWKADFLQVNGFDETFEGWGHEDADLVLRLHHFGLRRVNGYFCTEVYHLWHRQNSRAQEGLNHQRVIERMRTGIVQADRGVRDSLNAPEVVICNLN